LNQLKNLIETYGRWQALDIFISRIESNIHVDFSISIENSKSLLESISKQICSDKSCPLTGLESISKLVKIAFGQIGYEKKSHINVIAGSLTAITQELGELRNNVGTNSHGKTLEEIENRNNSLNEISKNFMLNTIESVACLMIHSYENENPRVSHKKEKINYMDNENFNEDFDEIYGQFSIGNDYSYFASDIFYNLEYPAYETASNNYTKNNEEVEE
jgi:hypothetical protein